MTLKPISRQVAGISINAAISTKTAERDLRPVKGWPQLLGGAIFSAFWVIFMLKPNWFPLHRVGSDLNCVFNWQNGVSRLGSIDRNLAALLQMRRPFAREVFGLAVSMLFAFFRNPSVGGDGNLTSLNEITANRQGCGKGVVLSV
ncbi:MAG TPA: hypothetical protein VMF11_02900 [Candidatus Baltobacteraceae bacterium]|nr:hypothetical protein [Candidatus Baltobacteraceae bacterium]